MYIFCLSFYSKTQALCLAHDICSINVMNEWMNSTLQRPEVITCHWVFLTTSSLCTALCSQALNSWPSYTIFMPNSQGYVYTARISRRRAVRLSWDIYNQEGCDLWCSLTAWPAMKGRFSLRMKFWIPSHRDPGEICISRTAWFYSWGPQEHRKATEAVTKHTHIWQ